MGIETNGVRPGDTSTESIRRRSTPRFFKVFLDDMCSHRLEVSPAFLKHIEANLPSTCSITGQSGNTWVMELVKDENGGVFFEDGWDEFVKDNSLDTGDFMVFEYRGNCRFSVLIFDASLCLKVKAFSACPSGFVGNLKLSTSSRMNVYGYNAPERTPNSNAKLQSESLISVALGDHLHTFAILARRVLMSHRRHVTLEEIKRTRKAADLFRSENPFFIRVIRKSDIFLHQKMYIPKPFAALHLSEYSSHYLLRSSNEKLYSVRILFKMKGIYITAGWRVFVYENSVEEHDACVFELIKENEFRVHIYRVVEKVAPMTWTRS